MKSKETKKLMDEFNEDFSDMEGLFDTTLPDPTMVEFYRRLKNREILWNDDIDDATIDAAWLINPYPAEMNLHYNGKDHKVQVYFFVNATNSMGAIGTVTNKDGVKKKQIQMWVTAAAIYADEKQTSWLNSYVQFYFVADVATLD